MVLEQLNMPKSRWSFLAMDLRKAAATRSRASSQVAGRCEPFSRTRGWVRRSFICLGMEPPTQTLQEIVALSRAGAPIAGTREWWRSPTMHGKNHRTDGHEERN